MAAGVTALAVLGEAGRAKEWMARALLIDPGNLRMRYNFACALIAHLGDADAALAMLAPVLAQDPGANVRGAMFDPDFDALRDDPRFQAMLAAAEARTEKGLAQPTARRRRSPLRVRLRLLPWCSRPRRISALGPTRSSLALRA